MTRKYFAPTPPSEDVRSTYRVSLEEQIILVGEANETAERSEDLLCEAERLGDLARALEDLAEIADGIDKATPIELDLIDNVAQMACAGSDVPPDELLAGPELAVGQSIATEGWKETAGKIWQAIKSLVGKIWDAIDKFFKVHVILPTIYAKLQLLLKQVKNRTNQLKYGANAQMSVEHGLQYFSNGQRVARSAPEFVKELERFASAVELVYVTNPKRVTAVASELATEIEKWTPESTDQVADALRATLLKGQSTQGFNLPLNFTSKEGEFTVHSCQEVLGCVYFQMRTIDDNPSIGSLTMVGALRHGGLSLLEGEEPKDDEIMFKHAQANVYERAILLVTDMLQKIAQFNKSGGALASMRQVKNKLEKASDNAIIEAEKMAEEQPHEAAFVKMLLDFNPAFARWVQQPAVTFYTKVIGVARALMMILSHFCAVYEIADKGKEQSIMNEMNGIKSQGGKEAAA
jgi:hypothetical protein